MTTLSLDSSTIASVSKLPVYDATGKAFDFGSLYHGEKTIVVFIRWHFFCGQYVMELAKVPQEALRQAAIRLVVIGCGDWHPIQDYCDITGYKGDMFADPSRALYQCLGLTESLERTPAGQEKRSYLAGRSFLGNLVRSIWNNRVSDNRKDR
ncbi:predicted protein [Postia placenta Mad-698-R]|uniref:Alkyl hydroperoxide reductase subunit C/ Thiol specific antioxidant domain-containing protein n=1 Tax=Postia placenta MAD-698-R-SB12 TaxID=670580 RepID=A0A1X6NEE4_9APHY|nr:hypothetical protein POSPLADRAFT_1042173 [Postia placenta MAD-698-R-SB12]EED80488.1 predicted protein [Postia placenta Mad-698-R]OSX66872.1 hypothetical protein POSPLADRAFT_1042173 [Postia placenta MAD-698-R-SB12]